MSDRSDRGYWERHARRYDASLGPLGKPVPEMLALVARACEGEGEGDRAVLEVAAGTGLVTPTLAAHARTVIATDYAAAMVETLASRVRAQGLTNVTCEQADLTALRFPDASFDVVVAANVLHLVPDLDAAVASLRRVLKPGGRLIAPTFCHDETRTSWVVSRVLGLTGFPGHRRFTVASLARALEERGLHVRERRTLPGLLPIGYVDGSFA